MPKKVMLITGASKGIGYQLAERYQSTYQTIGLSRSGTGPSQCTNFTCDLVSNESITQTIRQILEKFQRIDVLVNNAAALTSLPLLLMSPEKIEEMVHTNLMAPMILTRAVLKSMIQQKSGRIVNVLSMSHRVKKEGDSVYAATKAGLEVFAQIVNREVHSYGITVNNVAVAATPTGMLEKIATKDQESIKEIIPHRALTDVSTIAQSIDFFLSDSSLDIGGQTLYFGGVSP